MNIQITPKTGALHYESGTTVVFQSSPVYSVPRAVPFTGLPVWPLCVLRGDLNHAPPLAA